MVDLTSGYWQVIVSENRDLFCCKMLHLQYFYTKHLSLFLTSHLRSFFFKPWLQLQTYQSILDSNLFIL